MTDIGTHAAPTRRIRKVLVANRGEVAVRVVRTARELGIASVAVYSDQDINSQACDLADEALALGSAVPAQTYLNSEAILDAAARSGADAVHPGYGFLSENADFAQAVTDAGLVWLGPKAEAIRSLGDKISARAIATSVDVPVVPGGQLHGDPEGARTQLLSFAAQAGYPVLVKRADAGGGRGITRFDSDEDVTRFIQDLPGPEALAGCFVEKMVRGARHVETQCARDAHGNFQVVTTRDCSVQRRNQKVVEEAPAPHLPESVDADLRQYSRRLFEAVDYVGVGTCEFLVPSGGSAYFLEVNPRLQVEHTVSEEVAGIDLVREQIRIAEGRTLTPLGRPRGHSFEVRITSENPADDLMPATGAISAITWPGGPGVRVDSFVRPGDVIGSDFDSLIAKLIVTAPTRREALARLLRAIDEFEVEGLPTSSPLLTHILTHPDFCGPDSPWAHASDEDVEAAPSSSPVWPRGDHPFAVHTKWMEERGLLDQVKQTLADAAGTHVPPTTPSGGVPVGLAPTESFVIELGGQRMTLKVPEGMFGRSPAALPAGAAVPVRRQTLRGRGRARGNEGAAAGTPSLHAPIQATVVRVVAEVGAQVRAGDLVVVLESMKMEKPIHAHADGTVSAIHVQAGATVKAGDLMVTITPGEGENAKEDQA
ncbi:ATP-grasp domain-containing protein [Schaalia sp. 19OD2882]|uniref:ATP-binding protein n=1 Tax=Schaalia sp. 19OD2882 TaxID=2794089 RepID=UPI001C1EDC98|nr:biotin carboxylase N-terminal domain-containing protein [Schaalia sp. 19OD2882]QWW19410.1 ATP-grasp domain-containing protein [Schaalia sp. 19OD2882]